MRIRPTLLLIAAVLVLVTTPDRSALAHDANQHYSHTWGSGPTDATPTSTRGGKLGPMNAERAEVAREDGVMSLTLGASRSSMLRTRHPIHESSLYVNLSLFSTQKRRVRITYLITKGKFCNQTWGWSGHLQSPGEGGGGCETETERAYVRLPRLLTMTIAPPMAANRRVARRAAGSLSLPLSRPPMISPTTIATSGMAVMLGMGRRPTRVNALVAKKYS